LLYKVRHTHHIHHLPNPPLPSLPHLLQNQFPIPLSPIQPLLPHTISIQHTNPITPQALINIPPVIPSIKQFFRSSHLS
ncbi:hypothetical protein, partial [Bacillus mycoides]|uniref:hypothetical protein n=1 Tax=Bacillus mycoides TaxID=1405 RepID=UPI001F344DFD